MIAINADNLDAYITEQGYTRGIADRGKMILIGQDIRIATWDGWMSYTISEPVSSLEMAEAIVSARRPVSQAFADTVALEQFLAENDGPKGYGL